MNQNNNKKNKIKIQLKNQKKKIQKIKIITYKKDLQSKKLTNLNKLYILLFLKKKCKNTMI